MCGSYSNLYNTARPLFNVSSRDSRLVVNYDSTLSQSLGQPLSQPLRYGLETRLSPGSMWRHGGNVGWLVTSNTTNQPNNEKNKDSGSTYLVRRQDLVKFRGVTLCIGLADVLFDAARNNFDKRKLLVWWHLKTITSCSLIQWLGFVRRSKM